MTLDLDGAAPEFAGKVVLITGAGGSIGSELSRQIMRFNPRRVILLERAESPLYFIQLEVLPDDPNRPPVGSIYREPFDGSEPVTVYVVFDVTMFEEPSTLQLRDIVVR